MVAILLYAGAGGALGAALRVYTGLLISRFPSASAFPYATLLVNLVGCFLIGLLLSLPQLSDPKLKTFLTAGFLGGLTTFSTFGYDTLGMLERGELFKAIMNLCVSLIFGLICCYLGQLAAKAICR